MVLLVLIIIRLRRKAEGRGQRAEGINYTGVKLTKKAMLKIEKQVDRLTHSTHERFPNLGKWFVDICCGST